MSSKRTAIALALMVLLVGVALADAYRASFEVDFAVTRQEVDALRRATLAREETLHEPPRACGSREQALAAVGKVPAENLGSCGTQLFGREASAEGPYYMTVAPGGVDFTVVGFALRRGERVEIRADRAHPAEIWEAK